MGNLVVSDNAATTLAASISNSPAITALVLADGIKFPTVNNGGSGTDWSYATLYDAAGNIETVKVTRHDAGSSNLAIVRGTAAGIAGVTDVSCLAWASGTTGVACRLIAQTVNDLGQRATAAETAAAASAASASSAAAAAAALLPAGTRMPFAQAAAPTGWTQDTTEAANNRMLRVVAGAGGGQGGTHSPILCNVVPAHTHGLNINAADPAHQHTFTTTWQGGGSFPTILGDDSSAGEPMGSFSRGGLINDGSGAASNPPWRSQYVDMVAHNHTGTTDWSGAYHSHSGNTDNGSSSTNWTPKYIDLIICVKN